MVSAEFVSVVLDVVTAAIISATWCSFATVSPNKPMALIHFLGPLGSKSSLQVTLELAACFGVKDHVTSSSRRLASKMLLELLVMSKIPRAFA